MADPTRLNAAAETFDPQCQRCLDFAYPDGWLPPPASTEFRPPRLLRRSY